MVTGQCHIISPQTSGDLGLCAPGLVVVNLFHLVGSFHICKTIQEYASDVIKVLQGFLGGANGKENHCQCRRQDTWV